MESGNMNHSRKIPVESPEQPDARNERVLRSAKYVPPSKSAEGDVVTVLGKQKASKKDKLLHFRETEFLKEIPKLSRNYEEHELEDARYLVHKLFSPEELRFSE